MVILVVLITLAGLGFRTQFPRLMEALGVLLGKACEQAIILKDSIVEAIEEEKKKRDQ